MKKYLASAAGLALVGAIAVAAVPPLTASAGYGKHHGPDNMAGPAKHGRLRPARLSPAGASPGVVPRADG